jgi:hypothetical protein
MSDAAQEAKDLLANKPDSDIQWSGSTSYRHVCMVIVKYGRNHTMRDLKKLRRDLSEYPRGQTKISSFKKDNKTIFIFKGADLNEDEAATIQNYYNWVVK